MLENAREFVECTVSSVGVLEQAARALEREQMALVREACIETT